MRTSPKLLISLFGAAAILAWGCGPTNPTKGSEATTPTPTPFDLGGRQCPPGTVYTYENFAHAWITEQCQGCHSVDLPEGSRQNAPIDVNFNTYADVRAWGVRIFYRAADDNYLSNPMPPAGGPVPDTSAPSRVALGDWLACNAPQESWATPIP